MTYGKKGQGVRFALAWLSGAEMRFEHPQQDAPQAIPYQSKGAPALLAEI